VADRGPGIIPEDQERIFDRFWRGKGVQFEGAGLGLAIVKEIMNAHGGRVSVENRSPDGANFTLHFTLIDRENAKSSLVSSASKF
jgi:two-component system sensor histidine kinase KdpD